MKNARVLFLLALAVSATGVAGAQNLNMSGADRSAHFEQGDKPSRGMSMASVEARFGTPTARRAAVGNPPITRWEYPEFAVFFEHDRVIHAVSK